MRSLLIGLSLVFAIIGGMVLLTVLQRAWGYYPGSPGWQVAEIAVEKGKGMSECKKILGVPWIGMGPTTAEQRRHCIHRYATLTKDPTVCELLLPNEYGLSCLSWVGGELAGKIPCTKFDGEDKVFCNKAYSEGEITIQKPQISNCLLYNRKDLQEWCFSERTHFIANTYECSRIAHPDVRDGCEKKYAFKKKDPSLCVAVRDERRRKYCEIRINTWLKYPQLRNSFYFGAQPQPTQ